MYLPDEMRLIKGPEELAVMRRAAALSDPPVQRLRHLAVGHDEVDLAPPIVEQAEVVRCREREVRFAEEAEEPPVARAPPTVQEDSSGALLAGVVPFQADTTFGMLMKHINEPPEPIPGISPELQMLINRALSKKPEHRYETAGELANEFMALFNGQTISPGTLHIAQLIQQENETGQEQKAPPEKPRTNWMRIGIEIGIATIVLLVAGLLVLGLRSRPR